jgi:uncharacterized protein YbbK (DUF523 family)
VHVAEIVSRKVPIGISACLYRCPVRYNGKALDVTGVIGRERESFVFTPVCPECMAGLGVPRPPMHLTGPGAEVLAGDARVRNRMGRDVTDQLVAGARRSFEALLDARVEAVIAKDSSPSCGLYKTRLGGHRREAAQASGVFGAMLRETDWFLIPDSGLANALTWWDWRRRLHAWLWLKDRPLERPADLYDAWHVVKFVLQETSRPFADAMGRKLAALPKGSSAEGLEPLRREILDALRMPSTRARIRQAMWKTYITAAKHGKLEGIDLHGVETEIEPPDEPERLDELADALQKLERISFENDVLFGTSPVIWRRGGPRHADDQR